MSSLKSHVCIAVAFVLMCAAPALAAEWFVAPGGTGSGSSSSPFGRVQDGLNAAAPGDTVTVRPGTYRESIRTVRHGSAGSPIRVRAEQQRGSVLLTVAAKVMQIEHAYIEVEGLVLDGQYAAADTVGVGSNASFLVLRNLEVRRSSKDLIDIGSPQNVLIEDCLIHHALNAANGRTDAHGVVALAARNLTIRDTEIHTFSGDAFQVDPARSAPGWTNVTIEGSRFWLAPLPAPENGFPAGAVPGENAVDTKAASSHPRATLTIRDTTAWGFRGGMISNMAAFNLKENVSVTVDRVTVFDSEIAFRLRGPGSATAGGAWVTIKNAVVYDTDIGFRYEDNIVNLKIWNTTLGRGVTRAFRAASSGSSGLEVRNLLVLGALTPEAAHASNWSVGPEAFVNAAADNYALAPGAAATDAGIAMTAVTTDRIGTTRPQGVAYDVGAYEAIPEAVSGPEVVLHAANASRVAGGWRVTPDQTAAGGYALKHPNTNAPRITTAMASPTHYFELSAYVDSGRDYRVWLRGKADGNSTANDEVWVQFSNAVTKKGESVFSIGTTAAARVTLLDCKTCTLSAWGWQDNSSVGSEPNRLGPLVRFKTTGVQTLRIQTGEDGMTIDQVVLSPALYLNAPPGNATNDTTALTATQ